MVVGLLSLFSLSLSDIHSDLIRVDGVCSLDSFGAPGGGGGRCKILPSPIPYKVYVYTRQIVTDSIRTSVGY